MKEAVRSGRRANFFITENRFIDFYAKRVGGNGVAVYSILQRCANSETRETWISANKMAEVLDMDRSTVYRHLKQLEDLNLIKTLRTRDKTIYVVLPVPAPREEASTPLFDAVDSKSPADISTWTPVASLRTSLKTKTDSYGHDGSVAHAHHAVAPVQPIRRAAANRIKEEQDVLNNTIEQENFPKRELATRIVQILGLSSSLTESVMGAVEAEIKHNPGSPDMAVERLVTAARLAERKGTRIEKFFDSFVARLSADSVIEILSLPATNSLASTIAESIKAEARHQSISIEPAAEFIATAALDDRRRGIPIDRFYFENTKWRNGNGSGRTKSAAERNLDAALDARAAARRSLGLDH